ncbi:hypothetical protein NY964_004072 [Salmonella enterica]|nr:hypothetical protein [Salmonella enterica]EDT2910700.1 hypothetical protein [Salmonella enterica subsp. enterica serovar Inverness]EAS1621158.1 hypothetical protein [Salmonella enterica]EAS1809077.1 hypothetical protein [Salmonella enterica]EAS4213711.1 hypothetical protein [Salmonella enterica]
MKTAFAKDINFVKTGNNQKSPAYYEEGIKERFKYTGLEFGGFVLPWVSSKVTQFRLINPQTGDYHDYVVSQYKKVTGDDLFKTEKYATFRLKRKCAESGNVFVSMDWKGEIKNSTFTYRCLSHDELSSNSVKHALEYDFMCKKCSSEKRLCSANDVSNLEELRIKREKILDELTEGKPYKFVRWLTEQKAAKQTKLECKCEHHGNWTINGVQPFIKKSLVCPECLDIMRGALNGMAFIKDVVELNVPVWVYVQELKDPITNKPEFIKFGISVRKPKYRMTAQEKTSIYKHSMHYTHLFENGWQALDVERMLHETIKGRLANKNDVPDGWTETRDYKSLNEVMTAINDYIDLNPSSPLYIQDCSHLFPDPDDIDNWFPSFDEAA